MLVFWFVIEYGYWWFGSWLDWIFWLFL